MSKHEGGLDLKEGPTSKVWGGLDHREGLTLTNPGRGELHKDLVKPTRKGILSNSNLSNLTKL